MASTTRPPRKTVEDLLALPPDTRAELIDGEITVTPSPIRRHQRAVLALAASLRGYVVTHRLGEVDVAPLDVHLPSGDVVTTPLLPGWSLAVAEIFD